jgi:3-dehydroquinate dehydratase-2
MKRVLVVHGPNLDRLGRREPHLYGTASLADVDAAVAAAGHALGVVVSCFQSNHEGALIDAVYAAADDGVAGFVVNAGALAHGSLALADCLRAVAPLPAVEVHLSNTVARGRVEAVVGAACVARVEGFGVASYVLALRGLVALLGDKAG